MEEIRVSIITSGGGVQNVRLPDTLPEGMARILGRKGLFCRPSVPPDEPSLLVSSDPEEYAQWLRLSASLKPEHFRFLTSRLLPASDEAYAVSFDRELGKACGLGSEAVLRLGEDGRLRLLPLRPSGASGRLGRYAELAEKRPDAFAPSPALPILAPGSDELRAFAARSESAGVVYENPPFWTMTCDTVKIGGRCVSYPRLVYPQSISGAVLLPRRAGDGRIGLIRVYRHGPRAFSLELPRGGRDSCKNESVEDSARRELMEELHVTPLSMRPLPGGGVCSDTSTVSGKAQVFLCDIPDGAFVSPEYEQIQQLVFLSEDELAELVAAGGIFDSWTLSALCLYWAEKRRKLP
jgi:8-oxo-dGTP pyrophosphatase MutT (NUDIX family)